MSDAEAEILGRTWFYEFQLPSGSKTKISIPPEVHEIHTDRLAMMMSVLEEKLGSKDLKNADVIEFASHEGYFASHLSRRCRKVTGYEVNAESVAAANMIRKVYDLKNLEFIQADVNELDTSKIEPADIVVVFGLMYHLENPVGVLRKAAKLARKLLLVETQTTMLDLSGSLDAGSWRWQSELHGIFGIVEGLVETRDGSTSDIVLVPSRNGLVWMLKKLNFTSVEIVPPPANGYEQLVHGRRVMVAATR
jgi:tRNA (mo5U34)-methyltransferase